MTRAIEDHQRRYRRRIIGVGAVLFVLTFVIPAPFVLDRVEADLEDRVGDELSDAGVDGVSVRFSGQDGTLECTSPLDDPDQIVELGEAEWGVRTLDLDESCTVPATDDNGNDGNGNGNGNDGNGDDAATSTTDESAATTAPVDPPATEAPVTTVAATTTVASTTAPTTSTAPQLDSIATLISNDPQFSQLAGLLTASGADATLADDGPFTLFAPTDAAFDAAFDALGPDAFATLTSDPTLVEQLVLHHVTAGVVAGGDLVPGPLDMLDGTAVTIDDADGDLTITSDGVVARPDPTQTDVAAINGLVHAIDMVLLPEGLELGTAAPSEPQFSVDVADGRYVLNGVVAAQAQRTTLLAALSGRVDPSNVDDRLSEDPSSSVTDDDVDRAAQLVGALPTTIVSGSVALADGELAVVGVVRGDEERAAISEVATAVDASVELADRPAADEASAAVLQDELNEFVRLNPITFEPNSADLTDDAPAIVEQVAGRALAVAGVDILIVGHTDSDGQPATNQQLSEARAAAVLAALVELGLAPETLTSQGRGQNEPVLVDGVEDKDASRRVEFVVTVTG